MCVRDNVHILSVKLWSTAPPLEQVVIFNNIMATIYQQGAAKNLARVALNVFIIMQLRRKMMMILKTNSTMQTSIPLSKQSPHERCAS